MPALVCNKHGQLDAGQSWLVSVVDTMLAILTTNRLGGVSQPSMGTLYLEEGTCNIPPAP